jgi:hypothetical protein
MKNDPKKLPQWARDKMKQLAAEVEHWKMLSRMTDETYLSETNVVMVDCGEERALPKNSVVRFKLGPKLEDEIEVHFGGRNDPEGILVVRTRDSGLTVFPAVSNVIHVRPGRA